MVISLGQKRKIIQSHMGSKYNLNESNIVIEIADFRDDFIFIL